MKYAILADILDATIDRPEILETTALGAVWLAGMKASFYPDQEGFVNSWKLEKRFEPSIEPEKREHLYAGWKDELKEL